jgi:large subunit ribosomal protein L35Ae
MEARIVSFRRGKRTQYTNQMIVRVEGVETKEEATKLIKKGLVWRTPGKLSKEINGVIKTTHGNRGLVRVHFERGMPGQSLTSKVTLK